VSIFPLVSASVPIRATQRIAPYLTPDEEQSLLAKLGSKTLSTVGYLGGALDKPGRTVRQVLASILNPEHETDWSEMLAWVPFSDTMKLTKSKDQATGKDILGWDDPRSWWDDVAGFGVEVMTDPLNLVSFGAAGALSKGGKALSKMGVLDEALEAAAFTKGLRPGSAGKGLMPRQTRITTTVDEALDLLKQNAKKLNPGQVGDEAARLIDTQFDDAVKSLGGDPMAGLKSEPIGGLFGIQSPFNPFGESVGFVGRGETAAKIAAAVDTAVDTLRWAPGIRGINEMFRKRLGGATTRLGQWAAKHGFKTIEEAEAAALHRVANAKRAMNASGIFDSTKVTETVAIENHLRAREYLELTSKPRRVREAGVVIEEARTPEIQARLAEITKQFDDVGLTPHLDDLAGAMRELFEQARDLGIYIPELRELEVGYWPRHLFPLREMRGEIEPMKLLKTTTEAQIWRQQWLKNLPEGTSGIMRLSLDKNFTIDIAGQHFPISGIEDRLSELGIKFSDVPNLHGRIREVIENAIASGRLEDIIPTRSVEGYRLNKGEIEEQLNSIIGFISGLDIRHADNGIPAFHIDVTDDFVRWMQGVHRSMGAADATHRMFGSIAAHADDLLDRRGAISVYDALRQAKLWTDDVPLEEQAGVLRFMQHFVSAEAGGLERVSGRLKIPANVINPQTADDWKQLRKLISGETLNNAGEVIDRTSDFLSIPWEYADEAGRVLDAYVNPGRTMGWFTQAMRIWQNSWRAGVTIIFPGFHTRNFLGGQLNNYFINAYDPRYGVIDPRRYSAQLKDTTDILLGNKVTDASQIYGGRMDDVQATNELMNEIFAYNIHDPQSGYKVFDSATDIRNTTELMSVADEPRNIAEGVGEYLLGSGSGDAGLLTNANLGTWAGTAADVVGTAAGVGPVVGGLFGRGGIGGVSMKGLKESTKDASKLYSAGHKLSSTVEAYNRISPYIALRRQGFAPAEAARRVFRAQVDYRNLSQFERKYMRGLVPFYSFTRGMVPFFIEDILMRPGGKQAHVLKGLAAMQRDDPQSLYTPQWMRRGASLRIPGAPDPERQRYISAVGAPFEDVLSLVSLTGQGPSETFKRTASGLLGRISPLPKMVIETATGRSMFFDRDLRDLESKYFASPTGGWALGGARGDRLIDLLPGASRAGALRKKFRDPKRYGTAGEVAWEEIMPWSWTDVDIEQQKARAIQRLLDPMLHGVVPDVRQLPRMLYMDRERLAALRARNPEAYRKMVLYMMSTKRSRDAYEAKKLRQSIIGGS